MSLVRSCDPIPIQVTPALNQAERFSSDVSTPPVGIILDQGNGPLTASTNFGPPTCDPGKILTTSAPSSSAYPISVTEPHPGDHEILRRLQTLAISALINGETIKFAPSWMDRKSTRLNSSHANIS